MAAHKDLPLPPAAEMILEICFSDVEFISTRSALATRHDALLRTPCRSGNSGMVSIPELSHQDLRYLTGYLSSIYSIATLRLSWLVGLPRRNVLTTEHLYYAGYFPCQRAQILGILIGANGNEKRIIYTVDDGSGATLECLCWARQTPEEGWNEENMFQVGQTVSIVGMIEEYRGIRQLRVETIRVFFFSHFQRRHGLTTTFLVLEKDPNAESRHMLRCAMLQQTKYQHPFSIAAEMARVIEAHQDNSLIPPVLAARESSGSQLDHTADFSSASYVSSDPVSEASYASFNRSSISMSMNQVLKKPMKLQKPSSIPDRDLTETTLRVYIVGYFKRHSPKPCSAHTFNDNEALKRLAWRISEKRTKVLRSKITNFARSNKPSSQEACDRRREREELNLKLFRECLGGLARDGIIVPSTAEAPAKGPRQIFYELYRPEMLTPVVLRVLRMLSANAAVQLSQGVSEASIMAEVREAEMARWHYVTLKEVSHALETLAQDANNNVFKTTSRSGTSRWLASS